MKSAGTPDGGTVAAQKAALRRDILAAPRPHWPPLLAAFLALPALDAAEAIFLFYGMGREPDTRGVIQTLLARGKTVALPRILPARRMQARVISGVDALVPGPLGIPQPGDDCPVLARGAIDLILVPNLCCDREGYRLGQGGGYYDRYLADYGGRTVALCPESLLRDALPREQTDVPVQTILTERGALHARG